MANLTSSQSYFDNVSAYIDTTISSGNYGVTGYWTLDETGVVTQKKKAKAVVSAPVLAESEVAWLRRRVDEMCWRG